MLPLSRLRGFRQLADKDKQAIHLVSGCFDLLHIGHLRFLEEAKGQNACLVVAVLDDRFVRERKGKKRPICAESDRLAMISGLRMVDMAVLMAKNEVESLLKNLRPDAYYIGGDRREKVIPEEVWLKKYNIPLKYTKQFGDESTTKLIEKIDKLYKS